MSFRNSIATSKRKPQITIALGTWTFISHLCDVRMSESRFFLSDSSVGFSSKSCLMVQNGCWNSSHHIHHLSSKKEERVGAGRREEPRSRSHLNMALKMGRVSDIIRPGDKELHGYYFTRCPGNPVEQMHPILMILGRELRLRESEYLPTALSRAGFGLGHSGSTVLLLRLCGLRIRAQATGRTGAKCQGVRSGA